MYLSSVIRSILNTAERSSMMWMNIKIVLHKNHDVVFFDGTIQQLNEKYEESHVFGMSSASSWRVIDFNHIPVKDDEGTPIYNSPILITVC